MTAAAQTPGDAVRLAEAFEEFTRVSGTLQGEYTLLRETADQLRRQLADTRTRLVASEEENRRLQEATARRSRLEAMGRMAAEIAHELRNPLGSLELTAGLLRDELEDRPEAQELVHSVITGIRALTRVSGDLLTLARPVRARIEPLDARACLERCAGSIGAAARARGVRVEIDAPEGIRIEADPEFTQQILLNLAQNALEASREGSTIRLGAGAGIPGAEGSADPGDGPHLSVRDDGEGIDAATLSRIFDPFFTTKPRGSGLGLPVSSRLADAQGARLEITSVPSRGTGARLRFPAGPRGAPPENAENGNGPAPASGTGSERGGERT